MTTAPATSANEAREECPPADLARGASRGRAWWTLYWLTLRQHLHGKRWMAVGLLSLLPAGMAVLFRVAGSDVPSLFLEFVLLWILIPQALLPLITLLYASGIVQDEQEEQTITYLLVRPISRWMLYWIKMGATWTTTVLLVVLLTVLTYAAIYAGGHNGTTPWISRCFAAAAILSLAAVTYCSVFGAISLLTKRVLIVGVLYTAVVEGLLASLPLSLRMGTVIYYTRMIAYRTLDFVVTWPHGRQSDVAAAAWSLNIETDPTLAEHPQLSTSILVLLCATVIWTALAGLLCSRREFHVKTPEKE